MKTTIEESLGFTARSLFLLCLLLCLQTGCTNVQSTSAELHPLQGTWEGFLVGNEADGKITIIISGDSLHFHRDTNHWFETTFTLPVGTTPQQLHATIERSAVPDTSGEVIVSIFKIEDGTLILAGSTASVENLPKTFEGEEIMRHEFRKVSLQ